MVLIRRLGKTITGIIWHQVKIRLRVEVAVIEGRGAYQRRRFEGGTDITPPSLTLGVLRLGSCQGRFY